MNDGRKSPQENRNNNVHVITIPERIDQYDRYFSTNRSMSYEILNHDKDGEIVRDAIYSNSMDGGTERKTKQVQFEESQHSTPISSLQLFQSLASNLAAASGGARPFSADDPEDLENPKNSKLPPSVPFSFSPAGYKIQSNKLFNMDQINDFIKLMGGKDQNENGNRNENEIDEQGKEKQDKNYRIAKTSSNVPAILEKEIVHGDKHEENRIVRPKQVIKDILDHHPYLSPESDQHSETHQMTREPSRFFYADDGNASIDKNRKNNKENVDQKLNTLLIEWQEFCDDQSTIHGLCSSHYRLWGNIISVVAILFSTIGGTANLATVYKHDDSLSIFFGAISIASGGLMSIHRTLNYPELERSHRFYSDQYEKIKNEIDMQLNIHMCMNKTYANLVEFCKSMKNQMDSLIDQSPFVPSYIEKNFIKTKSHTNKKRNHSILFSSLLNMKSRRPTIGRIPNVPVNN